MGTAATGDLTYEQLRYLHMLRREHAAGATAMSRAIVAAITQRLDAYRREHHGVHRPRTRSTEYSA